MGLPDAAATFNLLTPSWRAASARDPFQPAASWIRLARSCSRAADRWGRRPPRCRLRLRGRGHHHEMSTYRRWPAGPSVLPVKTLTRRRPVDPACSNSLDVATPGRCGTPSARVDTRATVYRAPARVRPCRPTSSSAFVRLTRKGQPGDALQ